jgi:hypothetical protein
VVDVGAVMEEAVVQHVAVAKQNSNPNVAVAEFIPKGGCPRVEVDRIRTNQVVIAATINYCTNTTILNNE